MLVYLHKLSIGNRLLVQVFRSSLELVLVIWQGVSFLVIVQT